MNLLYVTILLPLISFLFLAFSDGRWRECTSSFFGVGSIGLAALVTFYIGLDFLRQKESGVQVFNQYLWNWISVGEVNIPITLTIDALSLTMLSVVISVGFLIHMFASWYMRGQEGYSRFFAYTNLFIASMVLLILADNLLLMYVGWEAVGLCSYMLIGFYYNNPDNGAAAMKAFIITRIGDVFLAIGLFLLYKELGTLNIHKIIILAPQKFVVGSPEITYATLMLLCGAVGKSAQLPLQTWLADAMVGPTPVSALIHAATMVTAGVYLIARMNGLFLMAPEVLNLVGMIGGVTLLMSGFAALVQTNIKRILAYSTMSQIGYMFLALGVQAWSAAIFHLITHSFFKGLLFLSSGSVIMACNHEQNILKMGGLRKSLPLIYTCFLVGGSSLSALPIFSSGFYSKDEILWGAMASGHLNLMLIGLFGAFLTSLYTFRMIFLIFYGETKSTVYVRTGISHNFPLIVLIFMSTFIGALIKPQLSGVLPEEHVEKVGMVTLSIISGILSIIGIMLAIFLYLSKTKSFTLLLHSIPARLLSTIWFHAWGFDFLYNLIFIKPFKMGANLLKYDPLNSFMNILVFFSCWCNRCLSLLENGKLRWYIASMCIGSIIILLSLLLFNK
ncbi:NADH-quinone oxidoreductase subunit L [Candidatus Profftia tarda]|uniref:NADH-quinone oxidoreductase subunit L n=1 Tax=Candidatus Profftia tarda TaxID=1177216 RepID=A0A8E4F0T7_9ENTR|nr:NADH-quinone oxidoreductase subunit L [Candidatus Profftia tarda]CAD6511465.1 NADH-quinone oxidoreductase subunit L [Candidatus Profftia tarda]